MAFLVRKISRSKWPKTDYDTLTIEDIAADAITSCLRTSQNTLSTWEISKSEEVEEAILALASGFERLDTIDVVIIDKCEVLTKGFEIVDTPGHTPIIDLIDSHKDISNLTYKSIGSFSEIIINSLGKDQIIRFTKKQLENLLKEAIRKERLDTMDLKEGLRKRLAV